jgi:hypothetical protein
VDSGTVNGKFGITLANLSNNSLNDHAMISNESWDSCTSASTALSVALSASMKSRENPELQGSYYVSPSQQDVYKHHGKYLGVIKPKTQKNASTHPIFQSVDQRLNYFLLGGGRSGGVRNGGRLCGCHEGVM